MSAQLAALAELLDASGNFVLQNRGATIPRRERISAVELDKPTADSLVACLGGELFVNGPHITWRVQNGPAVEAAKRLLPWLEAKKAAATRIATYRSVPRAVRSHHASPV